MRLPNIDKFLFCMSLETGARLLGYLGSITSATGLIITTILVAAAIFNFDALAKATTTTETPSQLGKYLMSHH